MPPPRSCFFVRFFVWSFAGQGSCRERVPDPEPAPAPAIELPTFHVVERGESLYVISRHYYGTGMRWREILLANPGLAPEGMQVGARILIPAPGVDSSGSGKDDSGTSTEDER